MPDKLPSAVKIGTVQVKFVDGSERTLAVHGINQLEILGLIEKLGIKDWSELQGPEPTLQKMSFITHAAARALTFEKTRDIWNLERIEKSFTDMEDVAKAFLKCLELSPLPQALKTERHVRKQTPYH